MKYLLHLITLFGLGCACVVALTFPLQAQSPLIQKGQVRELNSNKKPIAGATIIFADAKAADSDGAGNFRLAFQNKRPGDLIFKEEIRKQGYELVNEKDFEIVKLSNTDQLGVDVILAVAGTVDAARKTYYGVSDEALLAGFNREKNSLRTQLQQAKVTQEAYLSQLSVLQEQYDRQKQSLDALAEKFARVNFDDVEPYYEEALKLFKAGKIDQAIQVLESADPAARTEQIIKEAKRIADARIELDSQEVRLNQEKEKQIAAVRLLADMYSLTFDPLKAEAQYDQLVSLDSTDLDILRDAADFYREQHRYGKAFRLYPKIISHPNAEDWHSANAYSHLGALHTFTGNLPAAMQAFRQYTHAYDSLRRVNPGGSFYQQNLAISYEKLGETYSSLGRLDSALVYYQKDLILTASLYDSYPENVSFKNGLAISYSKLGSTYSSLGRLDSALVYYQKDLILTASLYDSYPENVSFKNGLAISYSKLGETYSSLGRLDSALVYFQDEIVLFESLYDSYPENVSFKHGLAISYSQLGETYSSLGRLDSALVYFQERSRLGQALYDSYPENVSFKHGLAISYSQLGETYSSLGRLDSALVYFQDEIVLFESLYDSYPENVSFKHGLAISYEKLGETYSSLGRLDSALVYFQDEIVLFESLYDSYPENVSFKHGLAISYVKLASIYLQTDLSKGKGYLEQAEQLFSELVSQSPRNAQYRQYLDIVRQVLSELTAASPAEEINDMAGNRFNRVASLEAEVSAAADPASRVIRQQILVDTLSAISHDFPADPAIAQRLAAAYGSLAWFHLFNRQFAAAEQAANQGLETDPSQEWIHTNLALALLFQDKWEAAEGVYAAFKGKAYDTENTWNEIFLQDLDELEAEGITHDDAGKVRALLKE